MENYIFNISIAKLCQKSDLLQLSFKRDIKEFENYGFTNEVINDLAIKTNTLKNIPSDMFYSGEYQLASQHKREKRKELIKELIDFKNRYQLVFPTKSADYKLLDINRVKDLSDEDLPKKALHVCQIAKDRLTALSKRMITQEFLDNILKSKKVLETAIAKQVEANTQRREKTFERTKLANEIYKILSEISKVGKFIWRNKNEAYYKDYIIYKNAKTSIKKEIE